MAGGFQVDLKAYPDTLLESPCDLKTLSDVIAAIKPHGREEYPSRNIEEFELGVMLDVSSPEFRAAVDKNYYFAGDSGIRGVFQKHNLDVKIWLSHPLLAVAFHPLLCPSELTLQIPL